MNKIDDGIKNIPSNKFEFVNNNEKLHDAKFDTKPIGYLKDALLRFCRNKASVIAFIIIVLIVVFAVVVPIVTPTSKAEIMDTYYSKKGPRNVFMKENFGIVAGSKSSEINERTLVFELSKGLAAEFSEESFDTNIGHAIDSYYQPVIKYNEAGDNGSGTNYYNASIDTYLSVGFIYTTVEQSEYSKIVEWQEKNNKRILFPLINNNEYCYNYQDANYWYKTINKAQPVKVLENEKVEIIKFSENMVLEDNYRRDENGNFVYYEYAGGGDHSTAMYKVRVLYYNYYQYMYGFEPEYILGTDSQGYDLAYRMATGIRLSLVLAVIVSAVNLIIGAILGAVEGYYGGTLDLVVERVKDIIAGVPFIILATLFQMHLAKKVGAFASLIFAFVLTGWMGTSDRVRTQFYRFKNQEYVMAARTLGAKDRRIMWKHIFPNTLGTIITSSVLVIPGVIFSESMLNYLGIASLGNSKVTSLGTLLSDASKIWTDYPHLMIAPAVVISLLMICFNLFGNGLRDAFNPQLRGSEE